MRLQLALLRVNLDYTRQKARQVYPIYLYLIYLYTIQLCKGAFRYWFSVNIIFIYCLILGVSWLLYFMQEFIKWCRK